MGFIFWVFIDTITGVFTIFRLPAILAQKIENYPQVDSVTCRRWLTAERRAAVARIIMSLCGLSTGFIFILTVGQAEESLHNQSVPPSRILLTLMAVSWIVASIWSGIETNRAAKLRPLLAIKQSPHNVVPEEDHPPSDPHFIRCNSCKKWFDERQRTGERCPLCDEWSGDERAPASA